MRRNLNEAIVKSIRNFTNVPFIQKPILLFQPLEISSSDFLLSSTNLLKQAQFYVTLTFTAIPMLVNRRWIIML